LKAQGGIVRVALIYESLYGNTHIVANCIAEGLRERHEVEVVPVSQATVDLLDDSEAVVVGGPTHLHGMTTSLSRKLAAQAGARPGTGITVEPGALSPGLREWLFNISPGVGRPTAAFDTRLDGRPLFTGRASHRMARLLGRRGYQMICAPQSFVINSRNALLPGEAARARVWGVTIACALEPASPVVR
jgi:hypothetical protein